MTQTAAVRALARAQQSRRAHQEHDVQDAIGTLLTARGVLWWPNNREAANVTLRCPACHTRIHRVRASHIGVDGIADILGMWSGGRVPCAARGCPAGPPSCAPHWIQAGRLVSIEVKRPGARTALLRASAQRAWRQTVWAKGGIAIQAESPHDVAVQLGWA